MATKDEVVAAFSHFFDDVKAALAALQAKIDAGGAVEAADLDAIKAAIDAADAVVNPPAQPPA